MTTLAGYSVDAISGAWSAGNDAGDGYPWDTEARRGAKLVGSTGDSDSDLTLYRAADGSLVGVGDAHGPWAVTLTDDMLRAAAKGGAR